mgnify:CR=1 FL=1
MGRISFSDFAKLVGVSRAAITIAVNNGRLTAHEDETGRRFLIEDEASEEWINNTAHKQKENALALDSEKVDLVFQSENVPKLNDSRAVRESFKAKIEKLKYEEMLGKLVDIEQAQNKYFEIARKLRDSIMAIPDRISAELAAETNQFNVHKKLTNELRIALREIKESNQT